MAVAQPGPHEQTERTLVSRRTPDLTSYLVACGLPALATAVSLWMFGRDQLPDVVMIYLLGIMLVASRVGFGLSLVAAALSVAAFDFFFVPPYLTFAVGNVRHTTTFLVMFVVALVISSLTQRIRNQAMERARLANEAEMARRKIEAEQLRSSLLSSVSHDLRSPLAVITGATGTLLQNSSAMDTDTRRELLETVLAEAERLNRLIRNLLDMTRLESGAVSVNKEWLSLEEVVGSALNHLDARFDTKEVRVDLPRDLPLVPGDAVLLEQLLINLLENAAKYASGQVEIRAASTATELAIEVSDRGPGIAPGEEGRIFEKFQRSESQGQEGVGLGLAICRAIATAHGGRIQALNRDGGGATFRVTLPLDRVPPSVPPAEPPESHTREHSA